MSEQLESVECDYCHEQYQPEDVEPCDHGWWLCSTCDAEGACRRCDEQRAEDRWDEAAVDAQIEERAR